MTEYNSLKEAFNAKQRQYDMKNRRNEKAMESIIDLTEADRMQRQHDMLAEQRRQNRPNATPSLMESTTVNRETTPFISIIKENKNKGIHDDDIVTDGYSKYDPEPNADQFLINSGATILRSEITLTDSSGRR
jgi:hypothetical protein